MDDLQQLWGSILSRQPALIREAWAGLSEEERGSVYAHLERMVSEDGWAEPQRISARAALDALSEVTGSESNDKPGS